MHAISLRLPDDLAEAVAVEAGRSGDSVNGYLTRLVKAAVDPAYAGGDVAALRERLRRAGLLVEPANGLKARAPTRRLAAARAAAGRGRPLGDLVSKERD